jgi:hypothetical protein
MSCCAQLSDRRWKVARGALLIEMVGAIGIRMSAGGFQPEVVAATPAPEIVGVEVCGRNEITERRSSQGNRLTPLEEVVGPGAFRAETFRVYAGRGWQAHGEVYVESPPVLRRDLLRENIALIKLSVSQPAAPALDLLPPLGAPECSRQSLRSSASGARRRQGRWDPLA